MRLIKYVSIIFLFIIFSANFVTAAENPLSVENNKFGIHIHDENDLEDAARLVNSSGGDWGYVTIVIREDERDISRWQKVFDRARRLHLIPIVRLATKQDPSFWTKPDLNDIDSWIIFLDSLNWVVKNRYLIIGNEPNHATEWEGKVSPTEYAEYFIKISRALKVANPDYFIITGGLDASSPNDTNHMSEEKFIRTIINKYPNFYDYSDGFSSHSYPNPGFSSSPDNVGQISVKTYEWELSLLRKLGIRKILPVFVTETGWVHSTTNQSTLAKPEELIEHYRKLYDIYLNDSRIVAFTPFILNYSSEPFEQFSWKKPDGTFYPFYDETQKVLKVRGNPHQITEAEIIFELVPEFIKKDKKVYAAGIAKNTGQSIWIQNISVEGYEKDKKTKIDIDTPIFTDIEPGKIGIILYRKL